ncbi:MAG: Flp pilus assembly complex ATPase component TadA [Lachnospiraceae bacterium]|nr:Flp pilus assembly complex ATPase component TadA [Lachnospiraceae bacterium]
MNNIKDLLTDLSEQVSDLHLSPGCPVMLRESGELRALGEERISAKETEELLQNVFSEEQRKQYEEEGELSVVTEFENSGRLRVSAYRTDAGTAISLRTFFKEVPSPEDLRVPGAVKKLLRETAGLFIVSGRAGSGRTTTTAALLSELNNNETRHIISLTEYTEYRLINGRSLLNSRPGKRDSEELKKELKRALKADADVIVLGELSEPELLLAVMDAAQAGALVIFSMDTPATVPTLKRMIDLFAPEVQPMIRERLSELLLGILSQTLIPTQDGGRGAAYECLIMDQAIRNLIRESRYMQISAIMQTDRRLGMITMDDFLFEMVLMKRITKETALKFCSDKSALSQRLG